MYDIHAILVFDHLFRNRLRFVKDKLLCSDGLYEDRHQENELTIVILSKPIVRTRRSKHVSVEHHRGLLPPCFYRNMLIE